MTEKRSWNDVLGPVYITSGLLGHNMGVTDDLIGLTTAEGTTVYPHAQFDVATDGNLERREPVIRIWNQLIRPAIEEGIVDEWTATILLLQETPEHPSEAEIITRDDSQIERVTDEIVRVIARWRE